VACADDGAGAAGELEEDGEERHIGLVLRPSSYRIPEHTMREREASTLDYFCSISKESSTAASGSCWKTISITATGLSPTESCVDFAAFKKPKI